MYQIFTIGEDLFPKREKDEQILSIKEIFPVV